MTNTSLIDAENLCREIHSKAKYIMGGKEYPYYEHCFMVAKIVKESVKEDIDMDYCLKLCYLHDSVEDTEITPEYLNEHFGKDVMDGVVALSKDKSVPYEKQIEDSVRRIKELGKKEVAIVKMADRTCNISEILDYWSREKYDRYLSEARLIESELGDFSPSMKNRLDSQIKKCESQLKEKKFMKYLKVDNNLYAYDTNSGLDLRYLEVDNDWDLSEVPFKELSKKENAEVLSEKQAMEITGGHPPYQFIEEFEKGLQLLG